MATIVNLSDFDAGIKHVARDKYTEADQETFLTNHDENKYIYRIFGQTLGQEFITDLAEVDGALVPQALKWTTIFSPLNFELNDFPLDTIGIKAILVALLYNDFVTQQPITNQINGNTAIQTEASDSQGLIGKETVIYNSAVRSVDLLQAYVIDNPDDYTDFKGICFELQTGFL